jgi:hypothetical protein
MEVVNIRCAWRRLRLVSEAWTESADLFAGGEFDKSHTRRPTEHLAGMCSETSDAPAPAGSPYVPSGLCPGRPTKMGSNNWSIATRAHAPRHTRRVGLQGAPRVHAEPPQNADPRDNTLGGVEGSKTPVLTHFDPCRPRSLIVPARLTAENAAGA